MLYNLCDSTILHNQPQITSSHTEGTVGGSEHRNTPKKLANTTQKIAKYHSTSILSGNAISY